MQWRPDCERLLYDASSSLQMTMKRYNNHKDADGFASRPELPRSNDVLLLLQNDDLPICVDDF
jgi:hypothetical protein